MIRPRTVRRARRADIRTLTAIRREAILRLASSEMGEERSREWADSSADERVQRAIDHHEVWVAEEQGKAVGWVEIDRDRVEGIYVHPDLAGRGIGSKLLLHAEARVRSAGHPAVALDASENAEPFYLRRGYKALAESPADAGRPMVKSLHPRAAGRAV